MMENNPEETTSPEKHLEQAGEHPEPERIDSFSLSPSDPSPDSEPNFYPIPLIEEEPATSQDLFTSPSESGVQTSETDSDASSSQPEKAKMQKTTLIVIYWVVACGVLACLIGSILLITRPFSPKPTGTPTPNITQTLQVAMLTAMPPTYTFTPSPVPSETPTPRPTTTPLPTHTPSLTLSPTTTGTVTPKPYPPTLTPARPREFAEAFRLADWLPQDYTLAIGLAEGYPSNMPEDQRGPQNRTYYASYAYATILQGEALLLYPSAPEAVEWSWGQAYNLARTGNPQAAVRYADLIEQGFRNNQTKMSTLEPWIREHDPRLWLEVYNRPASGQNIANRLLKLNSEGGSAYLWMVDTEGGKIIYPLSSEFDFPERILPDQFWGDLTNDGIAELIIYHPDDPIRAIPLPKVFDVSQNPPRELFFKPNQDFEIGLESQHLWSVVDHAGGGQNLVYTATVYPPCPVTIVHAYRWNGLWFERSLADYLIEPVPGIISYCELVINQAAAVWGPETAIPMMETLLPDWPPRGSTEPNQYPLDAKDEWRYRLGIYYALTGDIDKANEYLQDLITEPTTPGSRWVGWATEFQAGLESPAGIYQACIPSKFCDQRIALQNLVAAIPPDTPYDVFYFITGAGVSVRYTSQFDFEADGIPERYFTFRHHPDQKLEFWIIAESENGFTALFVDTVDQANTRITSYITRQGVSIVWLGSQQSFSLSRFPDTNEVYITRYPPSYFYSDYTLEGVDAAINALLSGAAPLLIRDELIELRRSEYFACLNDMDCAYFYYTLGLANELGLDEAGAIDSYLLIWNDYPNTVFAAMARLKLAYKPGYGPPPTFTPLPTITSTPTNTPTITLTPTQTHTPGPSPTPTLTITPGPSPTPSNTPTPSDTPTPTNTATPTSTGTDTATPTATATDTPTP